MLLPHLSNSDYHKHPSVNSSKLKKFRNATPAKVKYEIDHPDNSDSDSRLLGTMSHVLLFEEHLVGPVEKPIDSHYIIESTPMGDKTRAERNGGCKEAWEAMKKASKESGIPIVKHDIWTAAKAINRSVRNHPYFPLIEEAKKEVSLFARIDGVDCKARYDAFNSRIKTVMDLKTCRHTLTNRVLQKEIMDLGYHFSAAMYVELGRALGLEIDRFIWIFVENEPPYSCRFVEASARMLKIGRNEFLKCLKLYDQCKKSGKWSAYSNEIDKIDVPEWYVNRDDRLLGEENG